MSDLLALSGVRQLITNTGARIRLILSANQPGTVTLTLGAVADCTLSMAALADCTLTLAAVADCTLSAV